MFFKNSYKSKRFFSSHAKNVVEKLKIQLQSQNVAFTIKSGMVTSQSQYQDNEDWYCVCLYDVTANDFAQSLKHFDLRIDTHKRLPTIFDYEYYIYCRWSNGHSIKLWLDGSEFSFSCPTKR